MSATRLVYFNLTGLGEPVRFLLSYCGEKFEDERINMEDWKDRKESFPYGKVPYLEIDGLKLHQSMAICRYIARKHGLTGKDEVDSTLADIMADTLNDLRAGLALYFFEADPAMKEKKKEAAMHTANFYLDRLEKHAKENDGYLVKGQLTWADLVFGSFTPLLNHFAGHDLFADRPHLKQLSDKIRSLPAIKTYLDNRPPHPF